MQTTKISIERTKGKAGYLVLKLAVGQGDQDINLPWGSLEEVNFFVFKDLYVLFANPLLIIFIMSKGFATDNLISKKLKKKVISNEPQGRLISWSPWPPANFQTRYPAFPFVLTILIVVIGQWYLSLLR